MFLAMKMELLVTQSWNQIAIYMYQVVLTLALLLNNIASVERENILPLDLWSDQDAEP